MPRVSDQLGDDPSGCPHTPPDIDGQTRQVGRHLAHAIGPGLGFETRRPHGTVVPHACHVAVSLGLNHRDSRGIEPSRDPGIRRFRRLPRRPPKQWFGRLA
jgi:hypothetical protein